MNKYSPYILYLVIALLVMTLAANNFGPMSSLQRSVDDFLSGVTADDGIRPNVVLVDIDGPSLDEYGKWPWNYDLIADLTAAVASGEPKSILLDIELYEDAAQEAAGHTKILAEQLAWIDQVILPYDIAEGTYRTAKTRNPEFLFQSSIAVDNPLGILDETSSLLVRKVFLPADRILADKPFMGFAYHRPDPDRLLRHQPLIMNYEGYYYPSTSLIAAATFLGVKPEQIKVFEGRTIQIGNHQIPINRQGEMYIKFSNGLPFAKYSAARVLSEEFSLDVLKNKAVIIGQLNGYDSESFNTPVDQNVPELVITATVMENILNNNTIAARDDLAKYGLLALLLLGALCAFVLPLVNMMYRMIILGGGLALLANAAYLLFASYGMIVPSVYIALELVLFMIASPVLDSALLSRAAKETTKTPAAKPELTKSEVKKAADAVPVRAITSSATDAENVKTTAINAASEKTGMISSMDHQTLNLDDGQDSKTMAAKVDNDPVADKAASGLTDSDAVLMTDQAKKVKEEVTDSQSFALDQAASQINASGGLKNLGRYQVRGILGKGAMGTVYEGVDPAINRPVALKTIRLDFVSDPEELAELKERLHREAQAAGKLSHPNIVTIYDVGSEGSLQYIAMEYLNGQTLEDMIKKKTRFNYKIIAQMISQICHALEYAHERGIVHRDIKPANIMVTDDYQIKVMDFGIARVDSNSMTKTGIAMGTPNYISPEQLKGLEIDRRADIFSLGVMMYEMLLGKRPFKGENITSLMYAVLNHEPEKPSSVRPQVPLLFDHIIGKALMKEPSDRYQKASDITIDLQDFVESFAR